MARTIIVTGIVQGVGFRPFVYCLAQDMKLSGFVRNCGGSVEICINAEAERLTEFLRRLRTEAPKLSTIASISEFACEQPLPSAGFEILESTQSKGLQMVPADTATCSLCTEELFDSSNRRYLYPFINCTACGPRFTIIQGLPYDRAATTMRQFPMCELCRDEYSDPHNRRFHAQPNACWTCGPGIWFQSATKSGATQHALSKDEQMHAVDKCIEELLNGAIIAIKGLGGFHLACDATNSNAVHTLRQRKHRDAKPFAVMFPDAASLRRYAHLEEEGLALLSGNASPIVTLEPLAIPHGPALSSDVAPGLARIGAMLPYTPLQHVIMQRFGGPLIMTSGNVSDEPICMTNAEAIDRLRGIAHGYLLHNRDIETRFDDSLVRHERSGTIHIRRSRGYAPTPLQLPLPVPRQALALGAQLKSTFCFAKEHHAFMSQHIGDLDNLPVFEFFQETIRKFESLFDLIPEAIFSDKHPGYLSTRFARELASERNLLHIQVQHHHAHIASCMADNGITEKVIGVAMDGTGYGDDDTIWGGEFLIADYAAIERVGSMAPAVMPGGEAAIRRPARMLAAYREHLGSQSHPKLDECLNNLLSREELTVLVQQLERRINSPVTTSCGRLFDAAAALIGFHEPKYEGHSAMLFEAEALRSTETRRIEQHFAEYDASLGRWVIRGELLLTALCSDLAKGINTPDLSFRFHARLSNSIAHICAQLSQQHAISRIVLSGGVFQNNTLAKLLTTELEQQGLQVYQHQNVPPNDGGISFGQVLVGSAQLASSLNPSGDVRACV